MRVVGLAESPVGHDFESPCFEAASASFFSALAAAASAAAAQHPNASGIRRSLATSSVQALSHQHASLVHVT